MPTDYNIEDIIQKMQELSLRNDYRTEAWKVFFEQEEMRSVIIDSRFLRALGDCVYLKQIGADLHGYLNEQLDMIAGYLHDYGVDYDGSEEMSALEYARSKVKSAYQHKEAEDDQRVKRVVWAILAIVGICFPIFARYAIAVDNQKRAQQQKEFQEQYMEWQPVIMEQEKKMMQDMLSENPEFSAGVREQAQEMLETGEISQEEYDRLMQRLGFDEEEEEAEEETTDN